MQLFTIALCLFLAATASASSSATTTFWPYERFYEICHPGSKKCQADQKRPAHASSPGSDDLFVGWLRGVLAKDKTGQLGRAFKGKSISRNVNGVDQLFSDIHVPSGATNSSWKEPATSAEAAKQLFAHLNFDLDPDCIANQTNFYYRKYDGSCNWLKHGEADIGALGTQKTRDYGQHYYADGISKPRNGPNARAVSNAFFKRKQALYYEHTPLLLGLIEFIMHDVTYSEDSTTDYVDVEMPEDETTFEPGTSFRVWRTKAINGTGTSTTNPREIANQATTWLDLSALYGSTEEVAKKLRSFKGGKLLTHKARPDGTHKPSDYLPFNTMGVPTRTRPHVKPKHLFAGGDPRTNEDWMMLGVHTLLLREHNRLCDILAKQHRDWDDEKIFQTIRLVMSAKYELIANSYQMAYWTDEMPWPRDDGFPLFRQMYGENSMDINPFNSYPWPLVTKGGKPMVVSVEMSVLYRFHEFIISEFPIIDAASNTLWNQDLFQTGFNARGFVETGLENILRGTVGTTIPNFKSGVDENFRSAGKYRGKPFDIVTWSIIHEREQGLPTFNDYFREYNKQDPEVEVPIRTKFEHFTSDKKMLQALKDLYNSPDEVDMTVGVQLDEEMFPGTTVPKSALIVSLFSLFGMGNSDRFSIGYAMTRCMLVDEPWDCHPSNALEELLWKKIPDHPEHPDLRMLDTDWLKEIDLPANGANLLWRLVTENTEIKCLQRRPLFPVDPETNPILCSLPESYTNPKTTTLIAMGAQFTKSFVVDKVKGHFIEIIIAVSTILAILRFWNVHERKNYPPVLRKHPLLGRAKTFQVNPVKVLQDGLKKYPNQVFGIKLATRQHFLLTRPEDMELLKDDNDLEIRFNLKDFMESINFPLITKRINFDTDMHTKMVRHNLSEPKQVAAYHQVLEDASKQFIHRNPLCNDGFPTTHNDLNGYLLDFITFVFSRFIVGPDGFDNDELLKTFKKFNKDATKAMTISAMLPGPLKYIAAWGINRDFSTIWKHLKAPIRHRRAQLGKYGEIKPDRTKGPVLMDDMISEIDDDERVSDLVALLVFGGLANLQAAFTSTFMDIVNEPGLQNKLLESLSGANSLNLNPFKPTSEWRALRSATFESIRLAGPATGPARVILKDVKYPSDETRTLPRGKVATLSSRITHRDTRMWGQKAAVYNPERFLTKDPPVGDVSFITWGLTGPHMCPGRWIALSAIQVMCKALLEHYSFVQDIGYVLSDDEKYHYPDPGNVERWPVKTTVSLRTAQE